MLRSHGLEPGHKLTRLQHALNAQSPNVFETMGVETRNCSAAHMSSAYSTIVDSWFLPISGFEAQKQFTL